MATPSHPKLQCPSGQRYEPDQHARGGPDEPTSHGRYVRLVPRRHPWRAQRAVAGDAYEVARPRPCPNHQEARRRTRPTTRRGTQGTARTLTRPRTARMTRTTPRKPRREATMARRSLLPLSPGYSSSCRRSAARWKGASAPPRIRPLRSTYLPQPAVNTGTIASQKLSISYTPRVT